MVTNLFHFWFYFLKHKVFLADDQFYNTIALINKHTKVSDITRNSIFAMIDNGFVFTMEKTLTAEERLLLALTSQG